MSELVDDVQAAADALDHVRDRIIVEDEYGCRFAITKAYAIGQKTDDPGIVMRIEMRPRE